MYLGQVGGQAPVSERLRILVDCAPLSGGGGSQVASAFLENLARTNDVEWCAVATDRTIRVLSPALQRDPRFRCVKKRNWLDIFRIGQLLAREEKSFRPDVVFSVFGPTYFRPRTPHLVGFALPLMIYDVEPPLKEPPLTEKLKTWLGIRAFKKSDHIVVETATVKTRLSTRLAIDQAKISVIGNSVNPLFAAALASKHMPVDDIFRMIIPSAYYPHKNLEIVAHVAAELKRRDPNFAFEFLFTLDASLPNWLSIYQDAVRLGVEKNIRTLGNLTLPELAAHYESSSAVFLPTIREASTAVYPESFLARRPLVTSDFDFARELCGDAALYVPPADAAAIADILLTLAGDVTLQAKLVAQGEARLKEYYPTADAKFQQQMQLIRTLAANSISQRRAA
jgi:glycosyltransferase involved in cell wall biosynthesis